MSVIPQQDVNLLSSKALAHVATLGSKGEPQSTPVWFAWDGEFVKIGMTKNRQKYRNIQRDQRVALSIVDPENPYHYLEIRGKVARIEDDSSSIFVDSLAKKYMGVDKYPLGQPGDERVTLYIEAEHATRMG